VGLFFAVGSGIVDFDAVMGFGGFVLQSKSRGGFGQVVAGCGGFGRVRQDGTYRWVRLEIWHTRGGGEGVELNGRGGDRERGRGGERQGAEAPRIAKGDVVVVIAHRVLLCKTGGVMRFGEHFCAADFYKSGFCRGKWVKIFLDLVSGAVGFLVTGAQRAWGEDPGRRLDPSASSGQAAPSPAWGRVRSAGDGRL
jgi:hypothetical protein